MAADPATTDAALSNDADPQPDLVREEVMLMSKAMLLETVLLNGNTSLEDRCHVWRRKIAHLETEILKAGKSEIARRYLDNPPRGIQIPVDQAEFSEWLHENSQHRASDDEEPDSSLPLTKKRPRSSSEKYHVFSVSQSREDSMAEDADNSHRLKRSRTVSKDKPPCLRCRILKKKCDSLDQCTHCPTQSYDNEGDYWKVLGCFRGHLRDLALIFCPDFSRSTQRKLKYRAGGIDIINFVLTKSRVSDQKKSRIMRLVQARDDFAELADSSWQNIGDRDTVSRVATSFEQYEGDLASCTASLDDYEAAWSVLQAISMDMTYLTKTTYNFFSLIRLGNLFSKTDQAAWELFQQAKRILRQSIEIYLLERLCSQIASGNLSGPPPFDTTRSTPNTLVLVDLKEDVENFLRKFEKACAGRAKLTGKAQLGCLYAILVFGVAKSMLIDTYAIRSEYQEPNPWSEDDALKITSAYKALVSVFCWSSKLDILLQSGSNSEYKVLDGTMIRHSLDETQRMVHTDRWDEWGYKGTKEFLLGLGSCLMADGSYNGFLAQRYGLDRLPKTIIKPISTDTRQNAFAVSNVAEQSPAETGTMTPSPRFKEATPEFMVHTFKAVNFVSDKEQSRQRTNTDLSNKERTTTPEKTGQSSFTFIAHDEDDSQMRTHGGRKGALDAHALKKAREVRKVGACWNCWVMKMPCSEGPICDRCHSRSVNGSTRSYAYCNRGTFGKLFTPLLFPEFPVSQFSSEGMKQYLSENTLGFKDDTIPIEVFWGGDITFSLNVSPFIPSPNGILQTTYHARSGQPLGVESLPIALKQVNQDAIEGTVTTQLQSLLHNATSLAPYIDRRTSQVSRLALEAVFSYYKSSGPDNSIHSVLKSTLLLHLSQTTTLRPILIHPSSLPFLLSSLSLPNPTQPPTLDSQNTTYSSRLLSLQLKKASYTLCRSLCSSTLSALEKVFRSRQKEYWGVAFASVLVLLVCIEQMMILGMDHVVAVRSRAENEKANNGVEGEKIGTMGVEKEEEETEILEREREQANKDMERVSGQLTYIFHALYRSTGALSLLRGESGFQDPVSVSARNSRKEEREERLIWEIRRIGESGLLAENPVPVNGHGTGVGNGDGGEEYASLVSGVLVRRFLSSFMGGGGGMV